MKRLFFYTVFVYSLFLISGCKNENWAEGEINPNAFIGDIRSLYKGEDVLLNKNALSGASQIKGVVTSDTQSGNIAKNFIVIQNSGRTSKSGINLLLNNSTLNMGDSVTINIEGTTLTRISGSLSIVGINNEDIHIVEQDVRVIPTVVTIESLIVNPEKYESLLVKIINTEPLEEPAIDQTLTGDNKITDGTGELMIHVEETSVLANVNIPNFATFIGVSQLSLIKDHLVMKLWPRRKSDVLARTIVLAWNLLGAKGNESTSSSTITDENVLVSTLSRGNGIIPAAVGGSFAATFPIDLTREDAIASGSYYEFTIFPKENTKISLSSLDVILRIQTSAPKTYIWVYSLDEGNSFIDIGKPYTWTTGFTDNNGIQQPQLVLSSVEDLQEFTRPIIFRIYAWGGASSSSNNGFRIGKSVTSTQHALSIEGAITDENTNK